MSLETAYIIETSKAAVGVVVRQANGYRFFAATGDAQSLEGRVFKSPAQAERAARRLDAERRVRSGRVR